MTLTASITQVQETLSLADKQIIASVLTWDTQRKVTAEEVETIAIVHDIVWVKLTDNRAIPLHVETFRAIRHQQLEEQTEVISDVEYVTRLEEKLEEDEKEIEVDSTQPGIYRVWKGKKLIGAVKRCPKTLCWIARPLSYQTEEPYLTSKLAIAAVVRLWEAA